MQAPSKQRSKTGQQKVGEADIADDLEKLSDPNSCRLVSSDSTLDSQENKLNVSPVVVGLEQQTILSRSGLTDSSNIRKSKHIMARTNGLNGPNDTKARYRSEVRPPLHSLDHRLSPFKQQYPPSGPRNRGRPVLLDLSYEESLDILFQGPLYVKLPGTSRSIIMRGYTKHTHISQIHYTPIRFPIDVALPFSKPCRVSGKSASKSPEHSKLNIKKSKPQTGLKFQVRLPSSTPDHSEGPTAVVVNKLILDKSNQPESLFDESDGKVIPKVRLPPPSVYAGQSQSASPTVQFPIIVSSPAPAPEPKSDPQVLLEAENIRRASPSFPKEYRLTPEVMHQPRPTKLVSMADIEPRMMRQSPVGYNHRSQKSAGSIESDERDENRRSSSSNYGGSNHGGSSYGGSNYGGSNYSGSHRHRSQASLSHSHGLGPALRGYTQNTYVSQAPLMNGMMGPSPAYPTLVAPQLPIAIPSPQPMLGPGEQPIAQETNGMVYYYDTAQYYYDGTTQAQPLSGPVVMPQTPMDPSYYYYHSPYPAMTTVPGSLSRSS
ncbi:uncharacterized protein V1516DRAFT_679709 [Lipomyces oligophaga]|uniref:uncharacterized protein n=1 Tax=Lipomyces oligophaga TaxID=45792 RepID=UPI0034CD56FC